MFIATSGREGERVVRATEHKKGVQALSTKFFLSMSARANGAVTAQLTARAWRR